MNHWGAYWPWFSKRDEVRSLDSWIVGNGSRLLLAEKGDMMWFFTSGKKCRSKLKSEEADAESYGETLAYLCAVMAVDHAAPEDDHHRIYGTLGKEAMIAPPLLIDDVIRPKGRDAGINIGTLRQAPWKLPLDTADQLIALLQKERLTAWNLLFAQGQTA